MLPVAVACPSTPEAESFVRYCFSRRRIGWPELYDEMCLVAARGLYRGMGPEALREIGVGLTLPEMPGLAVLVRRIAAEDLAARRAARAAAVDAFRAAAESVPGESTDCAEASLAATA